MKLFTLLAITIVISAAFNVLNVHAATEKFTVVGDGIPRALTATPGDADRGRAIVMNRQVGMCTLCHQLTTDATNADEKFQGNLSTNLTGAGKRWTAAQLRLRIVDSRRIMPSTIMPAYHRTDKLTRVGKAWQSQPIFSAQQVEDVVAYLVTLQ
jgi:L-cysteine S-thiosulfotransferase